MAAQELRWLTYLLTDLGERPSSPLVLYVDNNAAIALCQEHRLEHRTKHIALRYFLARELQQRGQLLQSLLHSDNKFYVNLAKSDFALKKVQFLGHMVSAEGVHVDPRKIEAVKNWKVPENMKELQQFLGFANYYNRFVPQYAKITARVTNLLKKDTPYKWDTPHQQAIEQLQIALTTAPLLILPDPDKDFVVEADASDQAVGAVLMQDHGRGL
ncbi:unnamed protein product [Closterium sp. NIES-54]